LFFCIAAVTVLVVYYVYPSIAAIAPLLGIIATAYLVLQQQPETETKKK